MLVDVETRAAASAGPMSRLPPAAFNRLLDGHRVVRIEAGGIHYRPGDTAGAQLVVAGLIRVSMASEEGRQITVRYARRGDVLGLPVAVSGSAPVHAQAVTDAVVLTTRPSLLFELAEQD